MPPFGRKKWERIVEAYYRKYKALQEWQQANIDTVHRNGGWMQTPTGRILRFSRLPRPSKDGYIFAPTGIKNYPVQSMATADITPLAMCAIERRMRDAGCQSMIILQVHDSIVFDLLRAELELVARITLDVFSDLSNLVSKFWGIDFNVPLGGEFETGPNYGSLEKYHVPALAA